MAVKGHKGEREERRYRSTVGSCFLGNDYLGNDQTKSTDQNHAWKICILSEGIKHWALLFWRNWSKTWRHAGGDVLWWWWRHVDVMLVSFPFYLPFSRSFVSMTVWSFPFYRSISGLFHNSILHIPPWFFELPDASWPELLPLFDASNHCLHSGGMGHFRFLCCAYIDGDRPIYGH